MDAKEFSESVRRGQKLARSQGTKLGRKRTVDYEKIYILKHRGMSYKKIAFMLGCEVGVIHYALCRAKRLGEFPPKIKVKLGLLPRGNSEKLAN